MAFILLDSGLLKQLPVHAVELEQEVLIVRKRNLAQTSLIKHHEGDKILLLIGPMVDHIHVNNVVFNHNIVALLWVVRLASGRRSPQRASSLPLPLRLPFNRLRNDHVCLLRVLFLITSTQLEHYVKNARSDIEIPKNANHVLELGLLANLKAIFLGRKGLELFEEVACSLDIQTQFTDRTAPLDQMCRYVINTFESIVGFLLPAAASHYV